MACIIHINIFMRWLITAITHNVFNDLQNIRNI